MSRPNLRVRLDREAQTEQAITIQVAVVMVLAAVSVSGCSEQNCSCNEGWSVGRLGRITLNVGQ